MVTLSVLCATVLRRTQRCGDLSTVTGSCGAAGRGVDTRTACSALRRSTTIGPAFHYDWLCTTARKAERLMAATKAQDLVNMDRKHGGGQAKGAKVQSNREQVARAQDGQITPGCFEIQDTRAWCTQTPVLARSTVTHRDACARVCVCPACGPSA